MTLDTITGWAGYLLALGTVALCAKYAFAKPKPVQPDTQNDDRIRHMESVIGRHREIHKWMHDELPMLRKYLHGDMPEERLRHYNRLMYLLGRLVAEVELEKDFEKE